ncbi:hypothetical protein [Pseudobacillus badius]|uniref:hypothetical protein n=1 Tax=Bacillus badius TaxID=1455 RepID=UPI003D3312C1
MIILDFEKRKGFVNKVNEVLACLYDELIEYSFFLENTTNLLANHRLKETKVAATSLIVNHFKDYDSQELPIDLNRVNDLKRYSPYNIFAWMKRFRKIEDNLRIKKEEYVKKIVLLLEWAQETEEEVESFLKQRHSPQLKSALEQLKYRIDSLQKMIEINPFEQEPQVELLSLIFYNGWKMDKNNCLSLLSLNRNTNRFLLYKGSTHKNNIPDVIDSLPEEINVETFEKMILIQEIEAPQENYFFKILDSMAKENFFYTLKTSTFKDTADFTKAWSSQGNLRLLSSPIE